PVTADPVSNDAGMSDRLRTVAETSGESDTSHPPSEPIVSGSHDTDRLIHADDTGLKPASLSGTSVPQVPSPQLAGADSATDPSKRMYICPAVPIRQTGADSPTLAFRSSWRDSDFGWMFSVIDAGKHLPFIPQKTSTLTKMWGEATADEDFCQGVFTRMYASGDILWVECATDGALVHANRLSVLIGEVPSNLSELAVNPDVSCILVSTDDVTLATAVDFSTRMSELKEGDIVFTRRLQYKIPTASLEVTSCVDSAALALSAEQRVCPGHVCLNTMWPCVVRSGPLDVLWKPDAIQLPSHEKPVFGDDPYIRHVARTEITSTLYPGVHSLWYCNQLIRAIRRKSTDMHDTLAVLLGTTGVGKSADGRYLVSLLLQLAAESDPGVHIDTESPILSGSAQRMSRHRTAYLSFPRFDKTGNEQESWPATGCQDTLNGLLKVQSSVHEKGSGQVVSRSRVLGQWVGVFTALLVSMVSYKQDPTEEGFDHKAWSELVLRRAKRWLGDSESACASDTGKSRIVSVTDRLVGELRNELGEDYTEDAISGTVFLDEIGTLLNSSEVGTFGAMKDLSKLAVIPDVPKDLSFMRALRHATRNLWFAGVELVVHCAGTDAGALNCLEYSGGIAEYRRSEYTVAAEAFEYRVLASTAVFPPPGCVGYTIKERLGPEVAKVDTLIQKLATEAKCAYPAISSKESVEMATSMVLARPLWGAYASLSSEAGVSAFFRDVQGKLKIAVGAIEDGVYAYLLSGLAPTNSSSLASMLLRHGFVHFHCLDLSGQRVDVNLDKPPCVMLSNPEDPLLALCYWRGVLKDEKRYLNWPSSIRWLLTTPQTPSAIGTSIAEPLAMALFIHARVKQAILRSQFFLSEVTLSSVLNALDAPLNTTMGWADFAGDALVNFTHVVDVPDKLDEKVICSAYWRGEAWRMGNGNAGIDFAYPTRTVVNGKSYYRVGGVDSKCSHKPTVGSVDVGIDQFPDTFVKSVLFINFKGDMSERKVEAYGEKVGAEVASIDLSQSGIADIAQVTTLLATLVQGRNTPTRRCLVAGVEATVTFRELIDPSFMSGSDRVLRLSVGDQGAQEYKKTDCMAITKSAGQCTRPHVEGKLLCAEHLKVQKKRMGCY
ncbi:hypothetical protein KIPB_009991, partial [Kipferlia bialata]